MNPQQSYPIPVTTMTLFPLLLIAAIGFFVPGQDPKLTTGSSNAESEKEADAEKYRFLSHDGLYTQASGRWDDPLQGVDEARKWLIEKTASVGPKNDFRKALSGCFKQKVEGRPTMLVTAVMIRGGTSWRRGRILQRHAVEASFAAQGYGLSLPDRMSYAVTKTMKLDVAGAPAEHQLVVPIKLYKHADGTSAVVLWIDEDSLGDNPLAGLQKVLTSLFHTEDSEEDSKSLLSSMRENAALAIVGPTNSDRLRNILTECSEESHSDLVPSRPGGRVNDLLSWLNSQVGKQPNHDNDCDLSLSAFYDWSGGCSILSEHATVRPSKMGFDESKRFLLKNPTAENKPCLSLRHFIGTNDQLVVELSRELERRGRFSADDVLQRQVVLFSSQSEIYTQSLRKLITDEITSGNEQKLISIPFLTGFAPESDGNDGRANTESGATADVTDYFRRTVNAIAQGNSQQQVSTENVGLVGILAFKTMDTATILKEARAVFPNAQYFVFDRDVKLETECSRWLTRNTLVASHYGLRIDGNFLPTAPAFRVGYQTATYTALNVGIVAFRRGHFGDATFIQPNTHQDLFDLWLRYPSPAGEDLRALQPVVIEMGLGSDETFGQVDIDLSLPIHQPASSPRRFANTRTLGVLLGITVFVTVVIYSSRPYSGEIRGVVGGLGTSLASTRGFAAGINRVLEGRPSKTIRLRDIYQGILLILFLLSALLLLWVMWYEDSRPGGERVSFGTGVSVWPSVIIFLGVIFASLTGAISALVRGISPPRDRFRHELLVELAGKPLKESDDLARSLFFTFLLLLVPVFFAWYASDYGMAPARSVFGRWVAWLAQAVACISVFLCVSVATVQTLTNRNLLIEIGDQIIGQLNSRVDIVPGGTTTQTSDIFDATAYFHWIEEVTKRSSQMLLLPSACILAFAVARLPIWDGWPINLLTSATLLTPFAFAIVAAVALRFRARLVRSHLVRAVDALISASMSEEAVADSADGTDSGNDSRRPTPGDGDDRVSEGYGVPEPKANSEQLGWFRDLLTASSEGAFGSSFRDPLLGSVLLVASAGLTEGTNDLLTQFIQALGL